MTADDELPIIDPSDIPDDTTAFLCKDPAQLKSFQEEIDHTNGTAEAAELLCVLAVIRHGDRTPKQKLKLTVRPPDSAGAAVHVAVLPAYTVSSRCLHSRQHSGAEQLSLLMFMNVLNRLDVTCACSGVAVTWLAIMFIMQRSPVCASHAPLARCCTCVCHVQTCGSLQVGHQAFISVFEQYKNSKGKQAKLKAPEELQTFLKAVVEVADHLPQLRRGAGSTATADPGREPAVAPPAAEQPDGAMAIVDAQEKAQELIAQERAQLAIIRRVLQQGNHFSGINRKVQLKPIVVDDATGAVTQLQVIVKWGGVLTHLGRRQAEELGNTYRMVMYPQSADGGGLLRLHSTYRHDLKIYSSDEGRVQTSAAAFAKGLLDLEGESLVCAHPRFSCTFAARARAPQYVCAYA